MKIGRRDFVAGVGAAAVWPAVAQPQQLGGQRRVAVMTNVAEGDADEGLRLTAFRDELRHLGWIEGSNIHIVYHWTAASVDLAKKAAAEIVGTNPDVIFVVGTTTVSIMLQLTRSIPVVFVTGADPVKVGFVKSLAKPSGNATGFVDFEDAVGAKWLQLLKEIVPTIDRVVFLHSDSRASLIQLPAVQSLAPAMGVQLVPINVNSADDIERAFDAHAGEAHLGLIVPPSSVAAVYRNLIIARAARHGFPAIYQNRRYTADGGLMSFGTDRVEQYRRTAGYVDRLLKGAKPDDLPVRQQEKSEFVLNLKAAKALGLDIPRIVLLRADEVIE
jgi:putative tryptophan/tyrosine transport system substrate-binding protein